MLTRRPSTERGYFNHGWLQTSHSFSFADYYDPDWMGFRSLRVINEDHIAGGAGFGLHPHRDMEIITYIVSGTLTHEDSMGHRTPITAGEVQWMSAGRGLLHSEYNHSSDPVHLLQIWILPHTKRLAPTYAQKRFDDASKRSGWCLIASPDGRDGSLQIRQDASLFATILAAQERREYAVKNDRAAWVQVVRGEINLNENNLVAGDGAALTKENQLTISSPTTESELLLFDLG